MIRLLLQLVTVWKANVIIEQQILPANLLKPTNTSGTEKCEEGKHSPLHFSSAEDPTSTDQHKIFQSTSNMVGSPSNTTSTNSTHQGSGFSALLFFFKYLLSTGKKFHKIFSLVLYV